VQKVKSLKKAKEGRNLVWRKDIDVV